MRPCSRSENCTARSSSLTRLPRWTPPLHPLRNIRHPRRLRRRNIRRNKTKSRVLKHCLLVRECQLWNSRNNLCGSRLLTEFPRHHRKPPLCSRHFRSIHSHHRYQLSPKDKLDILHHLLQQPLWQKLMWSQDGCPTRRLLRFHTYTLNHHRCSHQSRPRMRDHNYQ
jgi:hypothetical protein